MAKRRESAPAPSTTSEADATLNETGPAPPSKGMTSEVLSFSKREKLPGVVNLSEPDPEGDALSSIIPDTI